jgi:hypothetical protein
MKDGRHQLKVASSALSSVTRRAEVKETLRKIINL